MIEFKAFPKIPRFQREIIITEKIDGTNAIIHIEDDGVTLYPGSRSQWLTPEKPDNMGFRFWVNSHKDELLKLGPGTHFGEWWGSGIQRGYGLKEKRFSLFNTSRWNSENTPSCVRVVPEIYKGPFDTKAIAETFAKLREHGSYAEPGFMKPEGIVIFHTASQWVFKQTFEMDHGKG